MTTLASKIANDLKKMATELPKGSIMPTLQQLANDLRVSKPTLRKAMKRLQSEGIIELQKGRPARVAGNSHNLNRSPLQIKQPANQQIAENLSKRITNGEWQIGYRLPKIQEMSTELATSGDTLIQSLRFLESKKLIHKSGKAWLVGSKPLKSKKKPTKSNSFVLLIQDKVSSWERTMKDAQTRPFLTTFLAGFEGRLNGHFDRNTVGFKSALLNSGGKEERMADVIGEKEIFEILQQNEGRCLGALCIGDNRPHDWALKGLIDANKRVVHFSRRKRAICISFLSAQKGVSKNNKSS